MKPSELLRLLAATVEICGANFSPAAAEIFVRDLAGYPANQVAGALKRCRLEVRGKLTVSDVISRLDDGRPGPEEAWAMLPQDEAQTVVWTDEMRVAWGVARPLIEAGERVAARMAFKESYVAEVTKSREGRLPVKWTPTIGQDKAGRVGALVEACRRGRISQGEAQALLPPGVDPVSGQPSHEPKLLQNPEVSAGLKALATRRGRRVTDPAPPAEGG